MLLIAVCTFVTITDALVPCTIDEDCAVLGRNMVCNDFFGPSVCLFEVSVLQ